VNKIYTCKHNHNILVTKSDLSQLHVWDLSGGVAGSSFSTMGASSDAVSALRPTAVLQGHADEVCESNFSLDTSPASGRARVLSGDREGMILMWDIEANTPRTGAGGLGAQQVSAVSEFRGHQATVEDVCFHPKSDVEFCSVGDDKRLLFWDERASKDPTLSMPQWSQCDLHCLDWNETDVNLLVTGTADGETFVFDRRKLQRDKGSGAALHKLHEHKDAVLRVGWLPGSTTHFASGGDDASIYVWDLSRVGKILSDAEAETGPAEIIFKHSGHRGSVQDLHWNPVDPWCMASVSEDGEWAKTNTMQIWRPLDLLYKNDEDCINSLAGLQDNFRHSFD